MKLKLPGRLRLSTVLTTAALVVIAVVGASVLTSTGSARHRPPLAKPFTLSRLGDPGEQLALTSYAGRPVVINFFASWCTACQSETPLLARFYLAQHGRVLVIGVDANDGSQAAMKFVQAKGVTYPIGFDPHGTVTVDYGIVVLPQTLFLNARHQVVRHVVGALTQRELNSWAATVAHGESAHANLARGKLARSN